MNYYPLPPPKKIGVPIWPGLLVFFCGDFLLFVRAHFGMMALFWLLLVILTKQLTLVFYPSFTLYQYVLYFGTALLLPGHFLYRLLSPSSRRRYPDPRFSGVTIGVLRSRRTRRNLLLIQPGIALLFVGLCVLYYAFYAPTITAHTMAFSDLFIALTEQIQRLMTAGFSTLRTEHFHALMPEFYARSELVPSRSLEDTYWLALIHPLISVLALFLFNAYSLSYHTEAEDTAEPAPAGEVALSFPTVDSNAPSGPSSPSAQALSDDLTQE